MKRFHFNLEKVLKLRQYHEQEAKNELGRAISILTTIENNITQNAIIRSQAVQQRFAGINTSGAVSMLSWNSYINRLEQEAERLLEEAARAELVVEEKRNLYMEASRELKIMEKLKEKKEKEYRKEMFAAETRELDDRHKPAL
ncbi:MAG: flagellar export protein FliJ [Treponema sp.]|nr:flagellar export protein FliJ [Treponema sp.]